MLGYSLTIEPYNNSSSSSMDLKETKTVKIKNLKLNTTHNHVVF